MLASTWPRPLRTKLRRSRSASGAIFRTSCPCSPFQRPLAIVKRSGGIFWFVCKVCQNFPITDARKLAGAPLFTKESPASLGTTRSATIFPLYVFFGKQLFGEKKRSRDIYINPINWEIIVSVSGRPYQPAVSRLQISGGHSGP